MSDRAVKCFEFAGIQCECARFYRSGRSMIAPTINAEFADIFEGLEGLEGWERLKSLPEAEQEAFIESLFEEDSVDASEENAPATAEEIVNPGEEISRTENLPVEASNTFLFENDGEGAIIENKRDIVISGKTISHDLQEQSLQIDNILSDYSKKKSKWSGTTKLYPRNEMVGVKGKKDWSCDIILREDAGAKTTIHEHLHARSISHYNKLAFTRWYNAEEGAVELYARAICNKNNVTFKTGAYDDLVKQLQIIHSITAEFENDFDFAKAFYEVDLINRYSWLRKLADKAISEGNLSRATIRALNNAVEVFKRRM